MSDLRTVLVEGLFYAKDGKIATDRGVVLTDLLETLVGHDIHLAVHFTPSTPPEDGRWGGGCCMWQPVACPFGHHVHPDRIMNVSVQGVLARTDTSYAVTTATGEVVIPFDKLDGHYGRVVAATVFDVSQIAKCETPDITPENMAALQARASVLLDLMKNLKDVARG